jgi:hypothetical protein
MPNETASGTAKPLPVDIQPWFTWSINTWHFTHAAGFQCVRGKHADVHFPHNPSGSFARGCGYFLWAAFLMKKNHFTRSREATKDGDVVYARISGIAAIFIPKWQS